MNIRLFTLAAIAATIAVLSGCSNVNPNVNATQITTTETYGGYKHESAVIIPGDLAARGVSVRANAKQGDVGQRADFSEAPVGARPTNYASGGLSNEAEANVYKDEHLGLEVAFFDPSIVMNPIVADYNRQIQEAIDAGDTARAQILSDALGNILAAIAQAYFPSPTAVIPAP